MTQEYKKIDLNAEDFSIEIFQKKLTEGYPNNNYSLSKLKENNSLDIDNFGHQFMSLETLLKWKTTMNRDKDKKDIELINSMLINEGGHYYKYIKYKNKYLNITQK